MLQWLALAMLVFEWASEGEGLRKADDLRGQKKTSVGLNKSHVCVCECSVVCVCAGKRGWLNIVGPWLLIVCVPVLVA
jgi:hypothetical protein